MKKWLSGVLSIILLAGVGAGLYYSAQQKKNAGNTTSELANGLKKVTILTSSTKIAFLQDPRVVAILEKNGLSIVATKMEQAKTGTREDLSQVKQFDAVWPTGIKAASDVVQAYGGAERYSIYSTPIAIATFKPLIPVLTKNGIVKPVANQPYAMLSLEPLLKLMLAKKRWDELTDNTVFPVKRGILVLTPDPRKSNTASLYLAMLASVKNNFDMPQNLEQAESLARELAPVITRQGFLDDSPIGPFEDYLVQGMGKAPLVLVQESQFIEAALQKKLGDQHVLLYPEPGLMTKHIMVAKSEVGKQFGQLLSTDVELQKIAASYGFRVNQPNIWQSVVNIPTPELLNMLDAPSIAVLNGMNQVMVETLTQ